MTRPPSDGRCSGCGCVCVCVCVRVVRAFPTFCLSVLFLSFLLSLEVATGWGFAFIALAGRADQSRCVRACGPGVSYFLSSFLSFLCFSEIEVKFSFERGSSNFFDDGCAGSRRFEWDQAIFDDGCAASSLVSSGIKVFLNDGCAGSSLVSSGIEQFLNDGCAGSSLVLSGIK